MIVIFISLVAAAFQMGLLLLTAKVVGIEGYSRFSLIIAVASFSSAVVSEWLRMIVARHGGSRNLRFRAAMLNHARTSIIALSAGSTVLGLLIAGAIVLTGHRDAAAFAAATGIVAGGLMLSDMSAAFLRYGVRTQYHYNIYTMIRVTLMGGAALIAALAGASGPVVAATFGAAGMVAGGAYTILVWPSSQAARPGLLVRLSGQGWSLATGSIGANLAMTLARVTLGVALPGKIVGSALLSIDLFARAGNVLGGALCTWGNRVLLDGWHHHGHDGAQAAFRKFSGVFLTVWYSVALAGLAMCLVIPIFTLHVTQVNTHIAVTLPTLIAVAFLCTRIFLFDCLLGAINRHREIALVSTLTTIMVALASLIAYLAHSEWAAASLFPATITALSIIYAIRNRAEFVPAIDMRAARFVVIKAVLAAAGIVAFELRPLMLVPVVAVVMAVDARQLFKLFVAIRRPPSPLPADTLHDDTLPDTPFSSRPA